MREPERLSTAPSLPPAARVSSPPPADGSAPVLVRRPALGRYVVLLFGAMLGLVVVGALPKLEKRDAVARTQAEATGPRRVLTAKVTSGASTSETTLPGTVAPFRTTRLYAKTTGFIREYAVDIGDSVKAGDVLAIVDAPETKEELELARARKREAEANLDITQSIAERKAALSKSGLVSQQEVDEHRAMANSAVAALGTTRAEVGRLGALVGYQKVVAPFDGVVVRRGVEKGTLVVPGTGAAGTMLFEIGKLDTLKVFVDVPQTQAAQIRVGAKVSVFQPSAPSAKIEGTIARTSGALDPVTRALRTEIHVPGGGPLLAGAFVSVRFVTERPSPPLLVPASALIYRKEGTRVATLDESNAVRQKSIVISRDLGKALEIVDGVTEGEVVVLNPPDDIKDGETVSPTEAKKNAP